MEFTEKETRVLLELVRDSLAQAETQVLISGLLELERKLERKIDNIRGG